MRVAQWQVPLLVMGGMILAELAFERLRRRGSARSQLKFRTGGLAALAVLVLVIGIVALGPSLADQLASVAAAIAGIAALWLTYQSYRTLQVTVPRHPTPHQPTPRDPTLLDPTPGNPAIPAAPVDRRPPTPADPPPHSYPAP